VWSRDSAAADTVIRLMRVTRGVRTSRFNPLVVYDDGEGVVWQ